MGRLIVTDYAALLDDEVRAFLARTETHYPPDAVGLPIEGQRAVYDRMCADFRVPYPPGVTARDVDARGVPCRVYKGGDGTGPCVLYLHGGGFVVGGLDSHDDVCAEICDQTGFAVVSVDYRLAPEHKHPAAFDDALAAFEWVAAQFGGCILLCGDSAGGNLAAALAHHLRGRSDRIAGQVLIYPGLGGPSDRGSYLTHAEAPGLTRADIEFYGAIRCEGAAPTDDPTFAPLQDRDFSGLPQTYVVSAQCDPLCDDGKWYCDAIRDAGGAAQWVMEPGLVHAYLRARHMSSKAAASFARIVAALARFGQ